MIIARTPFRISFFGGGSDYPEFYREHGGAVLCTAIRQYCYISIHRLPPFFQHRFRASYARTETVMDPSQFEHPLIRECLLELAVREGLEISHVSDLPGRTGLGTSSAFTVGLLNALHALRGGRVTAEDLARGAIKVERERVGDSGGHQDQYAAAYGGFLRLDFAAPQAVRVRQLALPQARLNELEQQCLLFYTGVEQSSEAILHAQKKQTAQNVPALLRMREMVDEAERILTSTASLSAFGELLHDSWQLKKSLASGISNDTIDKAYAAARGAGASGGKLLGAGGRGFLLVFAEPGRQAAVRARLSALREVPVAFGAEGSRIVFCTTEP